MTYSSKVLKRKHEIGYVDRIEGDEAWVCFKRDGKDVRTLFPLVMLKSKDLALEGYPVQLIKELRRDGTLVHYFSLAPKSEYEPWDPNIDKLQGMNYAELKKLQQRR